MKRYLSLFLVLAMLGGIFALPVSAASAVEASETTVEYLEDGSYIVTTITENSRGARSSSKSGSKSINYCNSKGEEQWVATIHGTFSYDGYSATCTNAYTSHTIYNSAWKLNSSSAERSGNQVIGRFVFKYFLFGVARKTIERAVVLTSSPNGVLS